MLRCFYLYKKVKNVFLGANMCRRCWHALQNPFSVHSNSHTELFSGALAHTITLPAIRHTQVFSPFSIPQRNAAQTLIALPVSSATVYILAGTSTEVLDTHYKAISCMFEALLMLTEGTGDQ